MGIQFSQGGTELVAEAVAFVGFELPTPRAVVLSPSSAPALAKLVEQYAPGAEKVLVFDDRVPTETFQEFKGLAVIRRDANNEVTVIRGVC